MAVSFCSRAALLLRDADFGEGGGSRNRFRIGTGFDRTPAVMLRHVFQKCTHLALGERADLAGAVHRLYRGGGAFEWPHETVISKLFRERAFR